MFWTPAFWFAAVSVGLWQYANAPFMPQLLAFRLLRVLPVSGALPVWAALVGASFVYFAPYVIISLNWRRIRRYLGETIYVSLLLWGVNVLILFPAAGKGIFGYREPPGALYASLFLCASHWVFARALQKASYPSALSDA